MKPSPPQDSSTLPQSPTTKQRKTKPLMLSVSQRTSFKRCRFAWSFRYLRQLEPKTSAPALRLGILAHKSLEAYYKPGVKRGVAPWITFEKEYERELKDQMRLGFRDEDGTWHDAAEMADHVLHAYVDHYGGDEQWRVIASEQVFEYPVSSSVTAIGVIDGVWRNRSTKEICIVDHKFVAQIVTRHLVMDDQAGQYWAFGVPYLREQGLIADDDHFAYMMFNFLRKATLDTREVNANGERLNKDGSVSKNQPAPMFVRHKAYRDDAAIHNMFQRTMQEAEEIQMARRGDLSIIKSPGQMNCGGCGIRDVCELHDVNQDWKSMARAVLKQKDGSKVGQLQDAIDYERSR